MTIFVVTFFFFSFYYSKIIEREKIRQRIRKSFEHERISCQKLLQNGYTNIISQKKLRGSK